jgi:hypothetical protein
VLLTKADKEIWKTLLNPGGSRAKIQEQNACLMKDQALSELHEAGVK